MHFKSRFIGPNTLQPKPRMSPGRPELVRKNSPVIPSLHLCHPQGGRCSRSPLPPPNYPLSRLSLSPSAERRIPLPLRPDPSLPSEPSLQPSKGVPIGGPSRALAPPSVILGFLSLATS